MDIDYSTKLVAFIDILGFRSLIQEPIDKAKLIIADINEILGHALRTVKENNPANSISVKLFSDCMCISAAPEYGYEMIYELSYIQLWFAMHGIFIRGALTKGHHFENEHMIFSKGLITAYDFEKSATYPRILIDDSLVKTIIETAGSNFIMKAPDRLYFIDYLDFLNEEGMSDPEEILGAHKNQILNQIREHSDNIEILAKYRWLSEYHNLKANQLVSFEDLEDDYAERLREQTIMPISKYFPDFKKPARSSEKSEGGEE